jgi:hypothetical protein
MMIAIWWKIRSQGGGKELKGGSFVFVESIWGILKRKADGASGQDFGRGIKFIRSL